MLALLIGPLLFLAAQLLIPGVTADPAARHELIAAAPERWALSHQVFVVAFAFALMWLYRLRSALEPAAPQLAAVGAFFAGFALLAASRACSCSRWRPCARCPGPRRWR